MDDSEIVNWLLDGDPVIRWKVLQHLVGGNEADVARERARVGVEGWGAGVLSMQDPAGTWGGGLYTPKWTSTFYTLLLLKEFGLDGHDEQARRGARILFDRGTRPDGGLLYANPKSPLSPGEHGETCVSGMGLGILSHFGCSLEQLEPLVSHLLSRQMTDGGWNCRYPGATHASFNTTILVLEGLAEWELVFGTHTEVSAARRRGEEFLLAHRLFRSHTTGSVINSKWRQLWWPGTWHYDVLRGLEYLTASSVQDPRMDEALAVLSSRRRVDGRWARGGTWSSRVWSDFEPAREPGRWMTVRAMSVLRRAMPA